MSSNNNTQKRNHGCLKSIDNTICNVGAPGGEKAHPVYFSLPVTCSKSEDTDSDKKTKRLCERENLNDDVSDESVVLPFALVGNQYKIVKVNKTIVRHPVSTQTEAKKTLTSNQQMYYMIDCKKTIVTVTVPSRMFAALLLDRPEISIFDNRNEGEEFPFALDCSALGEDISKSSFSFKISLKRRIITHIPLSKRKKLYSKPVTLCVQCKGLSTKKIEVTSICRTGYYAAFHPEILELSLVE